jgi:hypothetical protein
MLVFWLQHRVDLQADWNLSEEHTVSILGPEDGGSISLRNVGIYLQVHIALQPRRPV